MTEQHLPLFVCHANCSRSMVAVHLYQHLCGAPATSAGVAVGPGAAAPASVALLAHWGIPATGHVPTQLDRALCDEVTAIFSMGPAYSHGILLDYGFDLAGKLYLFADPFTRPTSFEHGEYLVLDPGFDHRPTWQVVPDYAWMRERVLAIRLALLGHSPRPLIPASEYLDALAEVDPVLAPERSHRPARQRLRPVSPRART